MFRHILKFTFLIVLLVPFLAKAQAQPELYLSFHQRLAVSYILLGYGETPQNQELIFDRAVKYFKTVAKTPVADVEVANFKEFLKHFKGQWPNTNSLALDINLIEHKAPAAIPLYVSKSPRVQRQIDAYISNQERKIAKLAGLRAVDVESLVPMLTASELSRKNLKSWFIGLGESVMADHMSEIDKVGEKIAESGFAKQHDSQMRIFMQTMFSEYFSRLSLDSKKMIISTALGENLYSSDIKKFEIMVQNSGPQLQKLLQVVARQAGLDGEMLEVFRALENSVRPVPWSQVSEILDRNKNAFKFVYFEREHLAVGTMAQVHRAKLMLDKIRHDVVVRFIKPGIEKRVEEDKRILSEVAVILDNNEEFRKTGAPKLEPIIEDITRTVVEELNQDETIERQKLARARYQSESFIATDDYKNVLQINVPKVFDPAGPSDLMVQEMVIGSKLDKEVSKYKDIAKGLKRAVIEELSRTWAREVLFGGGFFHSDLHQGNFMMQLTEPLIKLHILDFGMGGSIPHKMQAQVMLLGAGVELNNAEIISRAFISLHDNSKGSLDEGQFMNAVKKNVQDLQRQGQSKAPIEIWTAWALNQGIQLPYKFISLNRGIAIINKLLQDSGSPLNLGHIMKELAVRHPMTVYKHLVLQEKLSHKDLITLGWYQLKSKWDIPVAVPVKTQRVRCEAVFL